MTNVLLAIDGQLYGKIISDFVVNHQWAPNTRFKLLHVIELFDDAYPAAKYEHEVTNAAKDMLLEVATHIHRALPESDVSQIIRHGEPKDEILKEAGEWPAQLLVIGSHGRSEIQRSMLGSVSLSVLTNARCTVVVVRVPQKSLEAMAAELVKNEAAKDSSTCSR